MVDHTEEWQVFASNGSPIKGISISPTESRKSLDVIVGAVHVWMWRKGDRGIEILLQHRAKDKPTWPDRWDISFAGHIDAGEDPLDATIREGREEIGIDVDTSRLELIFSYRNFQQGVSGIKWVYLYETEIDAEFHYPDGEVQAVKWVKLAELSEMFTDIEANNLVPHPDEYFSWLIQAINKFT